MALSVYHDGSTYCVANSAEEAKALHCDEIGENIEDCESEFFQLSGDRKLGICVDTDGNICSHYSDKLAEGLELTLDEWIARELPKNGGKAFYLCTEDA